MAKLMLMLFTLGLLVMLATAVPPKYYGVYEYHELIGHRPVKKEKTTQYKDECCNGHVVMGSAEEKAYYEGRYKAAKNLQRHLWEVAKQIRQMKNLERRARLNKHPGAGRYRPVIDTLKENMRRINAMKMRIIKELPFETSALQQHMDHSQK